MSIHLLTIYQGQSGRTEGRSLCEAAQDRQLGYTADGMPVHRVAPTIIRRMGNNYQGSKLTGVTISDLYKFAASLCLFNPVSGARHVLLFW